MTKPLAIVPKLLYLAVAIDNKLSFAQHNYNQPLQNSHRKLLNAPSQYVLISLSCENYISCHLRHTGDDAVSLATVVAVTTQPRGADRGWIAWEDRCVWPANLF